MSAKEITSNSSVMITLLEKFYGEIDGLHLNIDDTYILTSEFVDFLNDFIFSKCIWLTEDDSTTVGKFNYKQGFDSSV